MSILREVLADLFKMFVADARLTLAVLALVGAVAGLLRFGHLAPFAGGALLLLGCLALVVLSVLGAARR